MKKLEPGMAYDTKKLNKLFAFLSILLLMTVVWVFLDDYIRPWKAVQIQSLKIKRTKLMEKYKLAEKDINKDKLVELEKDLSKAQNDIVHKRAEITKVAKEKLALQKFIKEETITNGVLNSQVSETNYKYEQAELHHQHQATEKYYSMLTNYKKEFVASKDRMKGYSATDKELKNKLAQLNGEVTDVQQKIKNLVGTRDLIKKAIASTDMGPIFALRNSPFADYMDPTLKIHQIVIDSITDDRYFQQIPKVDRCITCHTFINKPGYEDQANPFKTHPNLDLMVGRDSPHPMKKTGCTTCHGGEGHRVNDLGSTAHTPQNKKQEKEWIAKYNWHPAHHISQPMLKLQHTEASCVKCHKGVEIIPGAAILEEGRRNIEKFGCYGCHKIPGFNEKRKPGPSLLKIASKVNKKFFKNWVWEPKSFNKHAKMPRFFEQSNNNSKDHPIFAKKNVTEVNAIAEFIWEKSKPYRPFMKYDGGDANHGKELITSVGCMGCHGVEGADEVSGKVGAYAGPYLAGIGSKVDADWLVSWLKKPSHYQEDTIMPSLRLTNREASDITAYLMSLRNNEFEEFEFAPMDKDLRDEMLVTYFSAFDTDEGAQAKLAKMGDRERTLELGYRSVGKYGCYSCHNIAGFEGRAPIGPDLSEEGTKPITQFGYGIQHEVPHQRDAWITAHLKNPRRWDIGIDKPFKDIQRMPNFDMNDREAYTITTAGLSNSSEKVPLTGGKRLNADEKIVAEGMKVVAKYNCMGCHQIDGQRGDILAAYEDDINEGPPRLVNEGHRVQYDWFHYFLDNVYPIRPWLKVRMPSFNLTDDERNKIVSMFQHKAHQETLVDRSKVVDWLPGEKKAAMQMWDELACASCHSAGFDASTEPSAPNLYFARRRLRPSWIKKWLAGPDKILPGTSMPSFWMDGEGASDVLDGDADRQQDAMVKLLYEFGTEKLPTKNTKFWSKQ